MMETNIPTMLAPQKQTTICSKPKELLKK